MPFLFKKAHDNYLKGFILPKLNEEVKPALFISDMGKHEHIDVYEKCDILRKTYLEELAKNGYTQLNPEDVYEFFPIKACEDSSLLGNYIVNLPYCKFLEKRATENQFVIKLNGEAKDSELNLLTKILRHQIRFKDIIMVFDLNKEEPFKFLKISHIIWNNRSFYMNDPEWKELVQSGFTEMTLLLSIEHAMWHLIISHIIYISKRCLYFTEILKIFNMADKNVFIKSLEVQTLLFGTSFIFKQVLNKNIEFKKFLNDKISRFIDHFNIDTIFEDYFRLNHSDASLNWMPGMKSNIMIIKDFVEKIVSKKDLKKENGTFANYVSKKYSDLHLTNTPTIKKFLQILFVVGSAFHSTTFEFTKILMTDAFFNEKLDKMFYNISLQTIVTTIENVFGDEKLYKGKLYKEEVKELHECLETNRAALQEQFKRENEIFQNTIYTTRQNMLNKFATHTYTTYV